MTESLHDFLSSADRLLALLSSIERRQTEIRGILVHGLPVLGEATRNELVARLRAESDLVQREIDRAAEILHRITTVPFCS